MTDQELVDLEALCQSQPSYKLRVDDETGRPMAIQLVGTHPQLPMDEELTLDDGHASRLDTPKAQALVDRANAVPWLLDRLWDTEIVARITSQIVDTGVISDNDLIDALLVWAKHSGSWSHRSESLQQGRIDAQDHYLQICEEELRGTRGLLQIRELEHKRLRDLVEHLQAGQDLQAASIDALKADLRHARLWANWRDGADTTFTSHPTQGVRQAAPFCWDSEKRENHNVTASDGWRVGDLVT